MIVGDRFIDADNVSLAWLDAVRLLRAVKRAGRSQCISSPGSTNRFVKLC